MLDRGGGTRLAPHYLVVPAAKPSILKCRAAGATQLNQLKLIAATVGLFRSADSRGVSAAANVIFAHAPNGQPPFGLRHQHGYTCPARVLAQGRTWPPLLTRRHRSLDVQAARMNMLQLVLS